MSCLKALLRVHRSRTQPIGVSPPSIPPSPCLVGNRQSQATFPPLPSAELQGWGALPEHTDLPSKIARLIIGRDLLSDLCQGQSELWGALITLIKQTLHLLRCCFCRASPQTPEAAGGSWAGALARLVAAHQVS